MDFGGFSLIFAIFKSRFLHEKIIFFIQDFFPDKVWSSSFDFWHLEHLIPSMFGKARYTVKSPIWRGFSRENPLQMGLFTVYRAFPNILGIKCSKCQKSKLEDHTLSGKKSWMKNIIFSWRNLDLKIAKIKENPPKSISSRFGRRALHMYYFYIFFKAEMHWECMQNASFTL